MVDSPLSSDLELEASPLRSVSRQRPISRAQSTSSSCTSCHSKAAAAAEKDALHRHKALERRFDKAKQAVSSAPSCSRPPLPLQAPQVPVWEQSLSVLCHAFWTFLSSQNFYQARGCSGGITVGTTGQDLMLFRQHPGLVVIPPSGCSRHVPSDRGLPEARDSL